MRNKVFKVIVICLFAFSISSAALADEVCYWRKAELSHTKEGDTPYCPQGTTQAIDQKKCTGAAASEQMCCCETVVTGPITPKFKLPDYTFQIPIGSLSTLKPVDCTNGSCSIPWVSQYIIAIYNYGLATGAVIAVLMLMAAGLLWIVSGGDSGKITKAKKMIIGSVTGLLLIISLNIFISFINPDLAKLKPIVVDVIREVEVDGDANVPITLDQARIAAILGVDCSKDSVADIVNKSKGKVTYDQINRGKTGPGGTIYFDCSSYAQFVRKCARLSDVVASSATIFSNHTVFDGNTKSLKPGDLVGWPPDNKYGHVLVYLGNNLFGDCHGGSGRQEGKAIGNTFTMDYINKAASKYNSGKLYIKQ